MLRSPGEGPGHQGAHGARHDGVKDSVESVVHVPPIANASSKAGRRRRQGRRDFGSIKTDGTPTEPRFSAVWWEGGRQRRKRGFTKRGDAEAFLARVRTALADGVLEAHRRAEVTLAVVAAEWLDQHSAVRLRAHRDNVQRWKAIGAFFGQSAALTDVTPSRIMELRGRLAGEGLAAATVNRHLALLRTVLAYAVTAGYLQASPVRRFARGAYLLPELRGKRSPPLASNGEAARLLANTPPEWFPLFAFLVLTGARRGEAAGLRWEDVDLTSRLVTIRRSYQAPPKSGRARTVPISAELAAILARQRMRSATPAALVFPHPATGDMLPATGDALAVILNAACTAAGVPRMRVHDLRHAHASLWLMGGGTIADVQRNLGHSTPVLTTETYGHIGNDHRVREADARLALGLAAPGPKLVSSKEPSPVASAPGDRTT